MKNEKFFNQDTDIKVIKLLQSNDPVQYSYATLSAWLVAGSADTFAVTVSPSSSAYVKYYDNFGTSQTNWSISGMFYGISSFFFGRGDGVIPVADNINNTTNIAKAVFVCRPTLDEGLKPYTITGNITNSGTAKTSNVTFTDKPLTAYVDSLKIGNVGDLIVSGSVTAKIGTVFYDYGIMLFHGGETSMFTTDSGANSGFYFGSASSTVSASLSSQVNINMLHYKTQKYILRNIYWCRLFNYEFNYTSNPTSKQANGELIQNLQDVPSAYITTIGLYNNNDECLGTAKINPPIRKNIGEEYNFKVSLDFVWLLTLVPFGWSVMNSISNLIA